MVSIFLFIGFVSATFALVSKASLSGNSFNGWRFLGSKINPVHKLNVLRYEVDTVIEAGVSGDFDSHVLVDFASMRRLISAAAFVHPPMKDVVFNKQVIVRSGVKYSLEQALNVEEAAFKHPSLELQQQIFVVLESVVEASSKTPDAKQMGAGSPFLPLWKDLVEDASSEASVVHQEAVLRVDKAAQVAMKSSKKRNKLVR